MKHSYPDKASKAQAEQLEYLGKILRDDVFTETWRMRFISVEQIFLISCLNCRVL